MSHQKLRVIIIASQYDGFKADDDKQYYPELIDKENRYDFVDKIFIKKELSLSVVKNIAERYHKNEFDLVLQMCDGNNLSNIAGIEVVQALEFYDIPFTGNNSISFDIDKQNQKLICFCSGVKTALYEYGENLDVIDNALQNLTFPMLLKHPYIDGSEGMTKECKVDNPEQLKIQVEIFLEKFKVVLIEEFIDGPEFTVLLASNPENKYQPIVFSPLQVNFSEGESFKHFDLKWHNLDAMKWVEVQNQQTVEKLKQISQKIYVALGITGYGRADYRMNKNGEIVFLEMNSNPGIFQKQCYYGSADEILLIDKAYGFQGFMDLIFKSALEDHKQRDKNIRLCYQKSIGFQMKTANKIKKGMVIKNNITDYQLLKQQEIQQKIYYREQSLQNLQQENVRNWYPILETDDPNCEIVGKNLIALKDIQSNQTLTFRN